MGRSEYEKYLYGEWKRSVAYKWRVGFFLRSRSLSPEDIKRVEYHDNPGLRYGEGIDIVLDYITIKRTSGGNLGVDLSHQLNTFWMADYI